MSEQSQVSLQVEAGPDADAEEVAEATAQLRRELLELDVDSVKAPEAGPPPPGSKAAEVLAIGSLIVTLVKSTGLGAVVHTIQSWISRQQQRSVKLAIDGDTLEVTGVSSEEQRRLIDEWIARHATR
jgi:uncharacterized protein YidB (DUF937 family)